MGWNSTTKIATAPMNLRELATAGGVAGPPDDLGVIIRNGSWNKWAKYKAIKNTAIGMVTAADRINDDQGFVNILSTSATQAFNRAGTLVDGAYADWQYQRPSGVAGVQTYRLFDFFRDGQQTVAGARGYYGDAKNPFAITGDPSATKDPQGSNVYDGAIAFTYTAEEIALTDLRSFNLPGGYSNYRWIWCLVAVIPGLGSTPIAYPLTTTKGGSSYLYVGSPSSDWITGWFRFTGNANTSGTATAWLAIMSEEITTSARGAYLIHIPVRRNCNFDIINVGGQIQFGWTSIADPRQPSPSVRGLRLGYYSVGSGMYQWRSLQARVALDSTQMLVSQRVSVTINVYGWLNGTMVTTPLTATGVISSLPAGVVQYIDLSASMAGPLTDDLTGSLVSVQAQVGAETPFWLSPVYPVGGAMQHENAETYGSLGSIDTTLGSDYIEINQL